VSTPRTIIAMGGGGFSMEPDNPLLDDFILSQANATRPRVCFLPTASGDADGYIVGFYSAFASRAEASHLRLFYRTQVDIETLLLAQDVIYVGGGNTENMLAIWRTHGLDRILRVAWEAGVVLAGLPGSHCPHYDGEALRRPTYQGLVAEGRLPAGYAADDGAALVFDGTELREVVASRPEATAYRVEAVDGVARETRLPARYLG
jgi:peptidase E